MNPPAAYCQLRTAYCLLTMTDLRDRRVELILQQLQQLPTLPAVAVRVLDRKSVV